jgi:hypothetical protein
MSNMECPICMDAIDVTKNSVVTECGHVFHCSCLMQNVSHNGFDCPYCRTKMANEPQEEYNDEDEESTFFRIGEEMSDDALTSFRMFTQRLNGEEPEEEPEQDDWETDDDEDEDEADESSVPSSAYMAAKLVERGITYEDLVKSILVSEHDNFSEIYQDYDRRSGEIYGQFRAIISRYEREEEEDEDVPAVAPTLSPEPRPANPLIIANPLTTNPSVTNLLLANPPLTNLPEVADTKTIGIPRCWEYMYNV